MTWTSDSGTWRVEVSRTGSYCTVHTVTIKKRNGYTGKYTRLHKNNAIRIPQTVLNKYDELISLGTEVY